MLPHFTAFFLISGLRRMCCANFAKGLMHLDPEIGRDIDNAMERTKHYLWHGKTMAALDEFDDVDDLMYNFEDTYPKLPSSKDTSKNSMATFAETRG